jgi:hypothetical protein
LHYEQVFDSMLGMADANADVGAVIGELAALDVSGAERAELEAALGAVGRLRGWLDAFELRVARRLGEVASFPEKVIADAGRCEVRAGDRVVQRATTAEQAPVFEAALEAGQVTTGHVDALGQALRRLGSAEQTRLLGDADRLVATAGRVTVEEFARRLGREVHRLATDSSAEDRLIRQRRATRLRTWVDRTDGMWCVHGRFDPDTGRRLHDRIDSALAALFAEATPDTCPEDPGDKQDHLRALALAALVEHKVAGGSGRTETMVVVDVTTPAGPVVDWGVPVELPWRVLHEVFAVSDPAVVVVRNGVVLYAPGQLDLGRSTRLASRAQRRALRAIYTTCAIPGCGVHVRYTQPHHVIWWEDGGRTDFGNLLPLCARHHHCVHDKGWRLRLGPNRELDVILPDGQVMTTGPPRRQAA